MENKEKETFNYTYSAREQEEIKAIRKKYESSEESEDKLEKLRRLDAEVTRKATTVSLLFGIIGALILGMAMSLTMTDIGKAIGISDGFTMLIGILTGGVGIVLIYLAYPIYNRTVKKSREKIAPKIIRLTDELMK